MMLTTVVVFASLVCNGHAFKPPAVGRVSTRNPLRHTARPAMQAPPVVEEEPPVTPDSPVVEEKPELKNWVPFLPRPDYLDGKYAGDVGFDPLRLVTSTNIGPMPAWWYNFGGADTTEKRLKFMREAELKHARLAMLAAMGWPLSELLQGALPALTQNPEASALLETGGRAPSVLNGGLEIATPALGLALVISALAEFKTMSQVLGHEGAAGSFGFDPLGVYDSFGELEPALSPEQRDDPKAVEAWIAKNRKKMELAEIKNGRLAMLGITGFAFAEALWQTPVVALTPQFFMPFMFLPEFNQLVQ
mmetsp:Transcript_134562/g.219007  ORF Transcript_134562/g.219007 Transcript_134562/m.219007 type:complete len:305 (-) Transcript_134562:380-1294(-)